MKNNYEETKGFLNIIRGQQKEHKINEAIIKRKRMLTENGDESKNKKDFIAITNDIKFGNNVLQSQIDAFKASVNAGAKFASENEEDAQSNPLVYLPETGNLVFSGKIPNLGNMKFQFSLMDITNAPYIWAEGLPLTEDVVTTLNKMKAFYLNWKEQWLLREDLLQKLDKNR